MSGLRLFYSVRFVILSGAKNLHAEKSEGGKAGEADGCGGVRKLARKSGVCVTVFSV